MLLTVSIGNTNISYALFERGSLRKFDRMPLSEITLLPSRMGSALVMNIALASVVPEQNERVIAMLSASFGTQVLVAGVDLPWGIEINCDRPGEVGADRLLNGIAAHARTHSGGIIADIGTAITVDAVSARGTFMGGAIAPGPELMLRSLHDHTGLLPRVEYAKPPSPIGKNTVDAIRSGVHYGVAAIVESLIARMIEEGAPGANVFLTGGAAELIAAEIKRKVEVVPALTHEGMAVLASAK